MIHDHVRWASGVIYTCSNGTGAEKRVELSLNPLEDPEGGQMIICIGIVVPKTMPVTASGDRVSEKR